MDPTTPGATSPYQTSAAPTPSAGAISPTQLQAILAALNQQQGQNQAGGAQPMGQSQAQNANLPFSQAGNMIKGLISPPPTSLLGQAASGIGNALGFGGQPGGSAPGGASPLAANSMGGMPGGSAPMSGAPLPGSPNAFGAAAVPTPFSQAGSPDAMTQMLMGGAPGF
jgi:hypothetical protein